MNRREFLTTTTGAAIAPAAAPAKITTIEVVRYQGPRSTGAHLEIASDAGAVGRFGPLGWNLAERLGEMRPQLSRLLTGRDPHARDLEFETLWNSIHPGKSLKVYAEGIDPLAGKSIWGTTRGPQTRHSPTGLVIMALSAVDNALWDLRGKLAGKPVHQLIGTANRRRIPVYTRVGEGKDLAEARRQARELYDRGHRHQKWYFVFAASDGKEGFRANMELVRALREELGGDAILMFDNHSMRYEIGGEWVVRLAKAMLPYRPFWLEEPTAPEDLEGYARIKGETGITVAGGEHHFTRWQVEPFLKRKCLDWVQSDPDWCGGISEWVRICGLVRGYPGVRVVPHSDHILSNAQCVASQPEPLCPMLEYNREQTLSKLSFRTRMVRPDVEVLTMPDEPGLGPDIDTVKCRRLGV